MHLCYKLKLPRFMVNRTNPQPRKEKMSTTGMRMVLLSSGPVYGPRCSCCSCHQCSLLLTLLVFIFYQNNNDSAVTVTTILVGCHIVVNQCPSVIASISHSCSHCWISGSRRVLPQAPDKPTPLQFQNLRAWATGIGFWITSTSHAGTNVRTNGRQAERGKHTSYMCVQKHIDHGCICRNHKERFLLLIQAHIVLQTEGSTQRLAFVESPGASRIGLIPPMRWRLSHGRFVGHPKP